MAKTPRSSKQRFADFREEVSVRGKAAGSKLPAPTNATKVVDKEAWKKADKKKARSRNFKELLLAFFKVFRGYFGLLAFVLALLSVSTLMGLLMPAAPKFVIDYILSDNPGPAGMPEWLSFLPRDRKTLLLMLAGSIIVLEAFSLLIDVTGRWQLTRLSRLLQASFRRRVFGHAVRLPLWRIQAIKSGGVASVLRGDAGAISDLMIGLLYQPWRAIMKLVGTLVVLLYVDWVLVVGVFGVIPIVLFSHRTWIGRIRPVYRAVRRTRESIDGSATEAFGGMRVVRAFHKERTESQRFTLGLHLMLRQELLAWWWSRFIEIVWRVIVPAASASVLLYGGWRVIDGTLTIGDVILFTTYTMMLLQPIEALVQTATRLQSSMAGFDRVLDLLDEDVEFADKPPVKKLRVKEVKGALRFENVHFHYPSVKDIEAVDVLSDVSVSVNAGETIALVGPSGAGKTTFSNLVARFYDPSAGQIYLDGERLTDYDVRDFRECLGIVEQDVFLFDGSVRDNIAYGDSDASLDEIKEAARKAFSHDFIEKLEEGYDTFIGERGVRLSGGQKQRIAIARAILKDPRILILDEATSNLDSESEAFIQESLNALMKDRTSFVIAHRLSTVRNADRILVIEDGRIVEQGNHDTLVKQGGRYVSFLKHQLAMTGAEN